VRSRAWVLVLVLLLALPLAGCFGSGPHRGPGANALPPLVGQAAVAGCDGPVFAGRVRAREMDAAADPNHRSRMAAAMMVSIPSTRAAPPHDPAIWTGIARSSDGGATWQTADLGGWPGDPGIASSPLAGTAIAGDPIVRFLPDGTLLLIGLAIRGGAWIDVYAARFEGDAMTPTSVSIISRGGYGDSALSPVPGPYQVFYNDKPEVGVDPGTGAVYVGWMWRTNRPDAGSLSVPVVALSTDGGRSWQPPHQLVGGLAGSATSPGLQAGAFPFTTSDGKVHVIWWSQADSALQISDAAGGTLDFGAARKVADVGSDFSSAGGVIAFGAPSVAVGPGPGGLGERVRVAWTQKGSAGGDGFDALLAWSDDAAATWSSPVRVHADASGNQVLPNVAAGPDGTTAVFFIEQRDGPDRYVARMALTRDGAPFDEVTLASVASEPAKVEDGLQPIGDYYGLAWGSKGPVALWEDGREGTTDTPFGTAYRCVVPVG
jgi:hypothetical protein